MWKFLGSVQKKKEFTGVIQVRNHVEFHGSWLLALEFPMAVIQFCGIFRGVKLHFVLSGISKGKVANPEFENSRGLFPKIMSSTPLVWIFSGIAHV